MFGSSGLKIGSIIVKGPVYIVMDGDVQCSPDIEDAKDIERAIRLLRVYKRMSRIDDELEALEAELLELDSVIEGTELIFDKLISMIDDTSVNNEQKLRDLRAAFVARKERIAAANAKGTAAAGEVTNNPTEPTEPTDPNA